MESPLFELRYALRTLVKNRAFTAIVVLILIINRAMADRYWPDQDPIGRQIREGSGTDGDRTLQEDGVAVLLFHSEF